MQKILALSLMIVVLTGARAQDYTLVVHGGAGNGLHAENLSESQQEAYHEALAGALEAGAAALDSGASASETVVIVLSQLEDNPLFNAGRGSVLNWEGEVTMDASLMSGGDLSAGAVSDVRTIRNPIQAAQAVRRHSPHVLLSGGGAEQFAAERQIPRENPEYFIIEKRERSLQRYQQKQGYQSTSEEDWKYGTVGCAVLDPQGEIAAGTSTGGMTGKRYGRVGDSPLIGAGTYAHNSTAGISCTGHGEYFIRHTVAHDLHARMLYLRESATEAARAIIHGTLLEAGGNGGLIGVSHRGEVFMEFNTRGMLRGYKHSGQEAVTEIFAE